MLHIVQVVIWGVVDPPQLFVDEEKARAAYVECAKKHWEQRYLAYCEHHGAGQDSFLSAQSFIRTIDVSEKSMINFWTFNPDQIGLESRKKEKAGADREELCHLRDEIIAVKEELTGLLNRVTCLADTFPAPESPLVQEEVALAPAPAPAPAAAKPEKREEPEKGEKQEPDREKYSSKEWQAFVAALKRLGSGSKNDFELLPRDDWRQQVYSSLTSLEYWEWVAETVAKYKEEASSANYTVSEDPNQHGYYKFSKEGALSSESYYSEWEAWCAAGLHHRGN